MKKSDGLSRMKSFAFYKPSKEFEKIWEDLKENADYLALDELIPEFFPEGLNDDEFENYIVENYDHICEMLGYGDD